MRTKDRSPTHSPLFGLGCSLLIHVGIGLAIYAASQQRSGLARIGKDHAAGVVTVDLLPLDAAGRTLRGDQNAGQAPAPAAGDRRAMPAPAPIVGKTPAAQDALAGRGASQAQDEAPAAPQGAAGAAAPTGTELQRFRSDLLRHIERYRRYPEDARRASVEGVVQVHFVMDHDGRVGTAWVELSSGSQALDDEAVAAVLRAQPLPLPPSNWSARVDVLLPIGFSLK